MTTGDDPLNDIFPNTIALATSQRDRLFEMHKQTCENALNLMMKKNQDYGMRKDALANFRRHGPAGICVRIHDKFCRIESFLEKGFNAVKDETVDDTIDDVINYAILLKFMISEEKNGGV